MVRCGGACGMLDEINGAHFSITGNIVRAELARALLTSHRPSSSEYTTNVKVSNVYNFGLRPNLFKEK